MKLSEIFKEKPRRWGFSGDPYFWDHLEKLAGGVDISTPDELEKWIKNEHLSLTGTELTAGSIARAEAFAQGGMGSGGISGDWWTGTGVPLLKSRLSGGPSSVITVDYGRRSVCAGDDVNAGECTLRMPEKATLGDLMNTVLRGGSGNARPIPFTGADSRWVIGSNVGNLARIYTDGDGCWHIDCTGYDENTPIAGLGIEWVYGDRE